MSINEISIQVEKEVTEVKKAVISVADIVKIIKESVENSLEQYWIYDDEVKLEIDDYSDEVTVKCNAEPVNTTEKVTEIFDDASIMIEEFIEKQYDAVDEEETKKTEEDENDE